MSRVQFEFERMDGLQECLERHDKGELSVGSKKFIEALFRVKEVMKTA
jgi:hypothetical protein